MLIRHKILLGLSLLVLLLITPESIDAKPQYTYLFGKDCKSCHLRPSGGGIRDYFGFSSRNDVSLIDTEMIGLMEFFEAMQESNSVMDDMLSYGLDLRYQSLRRGSVDSEREILLMQASPAISFAPTDDLVFEGVYNFAMNYADELKYPGQQSWIASVIYSPSEDLPSIRLGHFQPSVGVKYDDHTMLVRQSLSATHPSPLLPIDLADYGAELNYNPAEWVNLRAGVFRSKNMSEIGLSDASSRPIPLVDKDKITTALRVSFWDRYFERLLNMELGVSYLFNDDFNMAGVFLGSGITGEISLIAEIMLSDKKDIRKTRNISLMATYVLTEAILLEARAERGFTQQMNAGEDASQYYASQYVLAAQIYLLPFIEIRPEYRIYDRDIASSYQSRWTVQLHLYY